MTLPAPPNFFQFKYGVIGLIIVRVKPCYTDTELTVKLKGFFQGTKQAVCNDEQGCALRNIERSPVL